MNLVFEGTREELLKEMQIVNANIEKALSQRSTMVPNVCIISTDKIFQHTMFAEMFSQNYGFIVYIDDHEQLSKNS